MLYCVHRAHMSDKTLLWRSTGAADPKATMPGNFCDSPSCASNEIESIILCNAFFVSLKSRRRVRDRATMRLGGSGERLEICLANAA